jgi:tRNA(Ile)-lysidine synthase
MTALGAVPPLALAVSGGADSMALLRLTSRWLEAIGAPRAALRVLTVDHGLRAEAAAEAAQVAAWTRTLGHPHHILCWGKGAAAIVQANVQEKARAARYSLLLGWCRAQGVRMLLLGHHRDDQAETFLLRLARGSGVDGLTAMPERARRAGVVILRPLLDWPKARLEATLRACGQDWIEEPSNGDPRFARVRLRRLMPALAAEGLSPERLAATARRMARARAALEQATAALLAQAARFEEAGYWRLDRGPLVAAPEEIGLRALSHVLRHVGGQSHPLRLARLEALHAWLRSGVESGGRTLAGCRILPAGRDLVLVVREPSAIGPPFSLAPGAAALWDGRFEVGLPADAPQPAVVTALGATGRRRLRGQVTEAAWRAVPAPARPALPALWAGDEVVAVPHLGAARPLWRGFLAHARRPSYPPALALVC